MTRKAPAARQYFYKTLELVGNLGALAVLGLALWFASTIFPFADPSSLTLAQAGVIVGVVGVCLLCCKNLMMIASGARERSELEGLLGGLNDRAKTRPACESPTPQHADTGKD